MSIKKSNTIFSNNQTTANCPTTVNCPQNTTFWGIIRVSSVNQRNNGSLPRQRQALLSAGVPDSQILELVETGKKGLSSNLVSFLAQRKGGETVVFCTPDRFSRDYFWAVASVNDLYRRGVKIFPLDSSNVPLTVGTQLHQFYEAVLIGQEVAAKTALAAQQGIAYQKKTGQYRGKPFKLNLIEQAKLQKALAKGHSMKQIQKQFNIARVTVWRYRTRLFGA